MTGGIGSGKSWVCHHFTQLGAAMIDADAVAREVVAVGSDGLQAVVAQFGEGVLAADGSLNRAQLRQQIFSDSQARQQLEQILHPRIRQRIEQLSHQLATTDTPYLLIAVPLLVEQGWQSQFDRILVIDCDEAHQIERTIARDRHTRSEVEAILATQSSRAARLAVADDIIDNSGDIDSLPPQIRRLDRHYRQLAAATQSDQMLRS